MFPNASKENANWIAILAITGIIFGALVALVQPNMKKLVAYSSVSHLGFVVLGLFSGNQWGLDGAVYVMLAHGISTGALFMLVGFLYERQHSLEIKDYGGVATPAPWLSTVFLVTTLASIGMPMLNNFVGEFLVLQGASQINIWWAVFAATGVILSACYMLWMYQRTFFGETPDSVKHHMHDLGAREWACIVPLLVLMVWMGIAAQSFLPSIGASNKTIIDRTALQTKSTTTHAEVSNHGR
jgi:NADH-quinone oxidoreductase subunit M